MMSRLIGILLLVLAVVGLGALFVWEGETAVFAKTPHTPIATTYYVCECDAEADGNCVNGNNANDGMSPATPWLTFETARSQFSSLAAGDAILFCQGGAFAASTASDRWVNGNCTAATPCTVADYTPPWASGDEARPILWRTVVAHGFALEDGGNAEHEEGYVFRNLDMRCVGCDGNGFFLYNDIDDVLIENVSIDGFTIGVHAAGSNPCSSDPDCDGENERLTVRNATIINNERQGHLGGNNGLLIEDSYFENNGSGTVFDHNIYVSHADDMVIRGNELYRSSLNGSGNCGGVPLVGHGVINNLLIEDNLIREDIGKAEQGCWGIAIDAGYSGTAEQFTNVVIRNNRVENVGNLAIGVSSCIDCVIENNVIVHEQAYGVTGIGVPDRAPGVGDAVTTNVTVRNNSISIGSSGTGISVVNEGNSHQIVSNAIRYSGSSNSWRCLRATLPAASYEAIDYNICGFGSGSWAEGFTTLADWQNQGWGIHSQAIDPGFLSNSILIAATESAAMVDAGDPTLSAPTSINGIIRDGSPDAGAYELGVGLTPRLYLPIIVAAK